MAPCESRHTEPDIGTGSLAMTTLLAAEPQLYVRDIAASCEFYARMLGFSVAFTYGEPPFYCQLFRDAARLNLRHVDSPVVDPVRRDAEQLLAASITLEDAGPLFVEYQNAGIEFAPPLRTEPWGARTFIVRDPDGNLLLFARRGE
jgi:catechol 2,3-dioxygenase-like lactoylglutathione lyase family enzyme